MAEELKEKSLVVKGEYGALAINLAAAKFNHWGYALSHFADKYVNPQQWDQEMDRRKQAVVELRNQQEDLIAGNPNDINFLDKIGAGMLESLLNPIELGAQVAIGMATGGLSMGSQVAGQLAYDTAQLYGESAVYENRLPTAPEVLVQTATSIAPDLVAGYMGKRTMAEFANNATKGDITVNIRKEAREANFLYDPNTTSQELFTHNPQYRAEKMAQGVDPYEFRATRINKKDFLTENVDENIKNVVRDVKTSEAPTVLQRDMDNTYNIVDEYVKRAVEYNAKVDTGRPSYIKGEITETVTQEVEEFVDYIPTEVQAQYEADMLKFNEATTNYDKNVKLYDKELKTYNDSLKMQEEIVEKYNKEVAKWESQQKEYQPKGILRAIEENPNIYEYLPEDIKQRIEPPDLEQDVEIRNLQKKLEDSNISYTKGFDGQVNIDGELITVNIPSGVYDSPKKIRDIVKKQLPKKIQNIATDSQIQALANKLAKQNIIGLGNIKSNKSIAKPVEEYLIKNYGERALNAIKQGKTASRQISDMEALMKIADISDEFDKMRKPRKKTTPKPEAPVLEKLTKPTAPEKPVKPIEPKKVKKKVKKTITKEVPKKVEDVKLINIKEIELANGKKIRLNQARSKIVKQLAVEQTPFLNEIAQGTKATVDDFTIKYEAELAKGVKPDVRINYEQMETAINNQFYQYAGEADYIASEYVQLLNGTEKDIIRKYGDDNTDLATHWLNEDFSELDEAKGFTAIYEDSVRIDELKTDINLDDYTAKQAFIQRNKKLFDENDELIIDENLLKNIKEASPKDRNILLGIVHEDEKWIELVGRVKKGEIKGYEKVKWMDKELSVYETAYSTRKKRARESVKLNQVVNKQRVFGEYDSYFTEKIKADNVKTVQLVEAKRQEFTDNIMPFYEDGYLKHPKDGDYVRDFANFIFELKKTRRSARWEGDYRTMGSMREFFEENKMVEFWTRQPQFLNTNAELVHNIFDRQVADIARFKTFGSASPFAVKNKINFTINKVFTDLYDKGTGLSDAQKKIVNEIKRKLNTSIDNEFLGGNAKDMTGLQKGSKIARTVIRQKILSFTGTAEVMQNVAMSYVRAQTYGGWGTYKPTFRYRIGKLAKALGGKDIVGMEYNIAQMRYRTEMANSARIDTTTNMGKLKKVDSVTMFFQRMSANQQLWLGEAQATKILDNLPNEWDGLENELKRVFDLNGITPDNYAEVRDFLSDHIRQNGLQVNPRVLSDLNDSGNELAGSARTIYYHLTNAIGDPQYRSKFQNRANSEIAEWYGMFKQFSKSINKNSWDRFMTYVDGEGMNRPRFSKQYFKDKGVRGTANDLGLFTIGSTMAIAGGASWMILNEYTKSDRTQNQRLALMEIRGEGVLNAIKELDVIELVDIAGMNPAELVDSSSHKIVTREFKKIYDSLTDEEKIALGTNYEDAFLGTVQLMANIVVGDTIYKNLSSLAKDDIDDLDPKIYGLDKEQKAKYQALVRSYTFDQFKETTLTVKDMNKRELDYLEDNPESYNKLPLEQREVFERALSKTDLPEDKKLGLRTEFAVIVGNTTGVDKIADKVEEEMDVPIRESAEEMKQEDGFKTMNNAQKRYYYKIMEYKGLEDNKENRDIFFRNFANIKRDQLGEKLKEVYNINRGSFIKKFSK